MENLSKKHMDVFKIFQLDSCGINQAINTPNVKHIIIITDSIHATERIFDSSPYLYQTHSAAIFKRLWEFFKVSVNNHINFWDCSSKVNWPLYAAVDCDTKKFVAFLSFPCKSSWDFCKSYRDKFVLNSQKMTFQISNFKERQFFELLNNDLNSLEPSTKNGGPWLKLIGHSNSLCVRATRAIVNHASIRKYQLRFFSRENFAWSCSAYPIESRRHILYKCK